MELIDTHTHLDFPDFDADRPALLAASRALGVRQMVVLGVDRDNWQRVWDLVQSDPDLHAALGLHPVYLDQHRPDDMTHLRDWLARLAGHRQLCAVGEIGLDYYIENLDRERQQTLFEAQLQLAAEFELPALIHVRRSHAAVIATLKRLPLQRAGIIHAFAGSFEEAREYIKLGYKLGLGGAATWPQALRMHRVLAKLPLDAVVLETDSPDMAPAMFPGQRNSPAHLPAICEALAEIMAITPEQLAEASTANARQLFNW
ncbi:YchF/TatD family DNA exonuclease [Pseudomonas mediterranea]|uniref:TatD DNase family protein n=1 Tax=Pseudomonas mediterranea TaxID=183795 RepID=A0AAX2DLR1_9PSED|nr:TatD family hydrolase [Pseudomonas mediterranea]KGU86681.1 hydrolase TatD [Pseudomonas mediterranea CFBP 5447]MDU9028191.1 TatD family hydrolase [Pseudomonas mediterranea]QHA80875.1 YchF/TatD family DNA exonuclease [Pseudomonas mediterranea]UZE01776.1 TatD family hydrolase [Pseudomonas mediterranea]CAH0155233.1 putative metal-dependent hydrolase YjjV [Pseudomonas mediterranea]